MGLSLGKLSKVLGFWSCLISDGFSFEGMDLMSTLLVFTL